jgi:hypothetical protein
MMKILELFRQTGMLELSLNLRSEAAYCLTYLSVWLLIYVHSASEKRPSISSY